MDVIGSTDELLPRRPLGTTGLMVTPICVGTNALGGVARLYGYDVEPARAISTISTVIAGPINFLDTSNGYAGGASELRIGDALRAVGGLPDDVVLATKVDPDPVTGDFSGDRVRRSVEESLERLGLDRVQLLYLHDPERIEFDDATAPGGPVAALIELRERGLVDNIGVAGGPIELMRRYVATGAFSVVLTHSRYTLLDRSAESLLDDAHDRGVGVVNAAPYGGGMLSKGPRVQPRYAYGQASAHDERFGDRVTRMELICANHGVPLAAAALQFSVRDPRITSTVVGISAPERVEQTLALLRHPIPAELWERLRELAPAPEVWLH
jgi:D-threo-aldose 1-dehydrogenase